jgi:trehalose synthase
MSPPAAPQRRRRAKKASPPRRRRRPPRRRRRRQAGGEEPGQRPGTSPGTTAAASSDLWWKTAVVYCLDVETFMDGDGDGTGDFVGLVQRLDHLVDLGVTCLWLMPFYPTAERDDGYDITDFYGVDARLGDHGDVVEFVRAARDRGMRVIVDLVVNHTSADHPWFQAALEGPDSPYRDFYVWRSDPPPDTSSEVVFPDEESGIWSLDEASGQWYLHRFFAHQPDLNVANPAVRAQILKVVGFWLELGISGFRMDAVPFLLQTDGLGMEELEQFPEPHEFLREVRQLVASRRGDGILLGEVNLPFEQQLQFFGGPDGDELDMQFDFIGMQRMYLSLARGDAQPIISALKERPGLANRSQWATFVRNHDELTLDKLGAYERQEVFDAFGPDAEHQLFGRGLRRRLPRCWAGTSVGSGWSTRCSSPCRARRCCSTARRSAWARTWPPRPARRSAPRCSGPTRRTAGSPRPRRRRCPTPSSPASSGRRRSTSPPRSTSRTRC